MLFGVDYLLKNRYARVALNAFCLAAAMAVVLLEVFHVTTQAMIRINFVPLMVCLAVFLPLEDLAPRLDASDIVQEVQIAVTQRIDDYLARSPMPFESLASLGSVLHKYLDINKNIDPSLLVFSDKDIEDFVLSWYR